MKHNLSKWVCGIAIVAVGATGWLLTRNKDHGMPSLATAPSAAPLEYPEGLEGVGKVFNGAGGRLEFEVAIETLDTLTRKDVALPEEAREWLLANLGRGVPPDMSEDLWSHLFNSTCNALGAGDETPDEGFLNLLFARAQGDPDPVIRLYALQHIGFHYPSAGEVAQKGMRDLVVSIIKDAEAKTAGTALLLWQQWEKGGAAPELPAITTSLAVAADASREMDVRISALHVAGTSPDCLPLARRLASDSSNHILIRKAALNLVGRHGQTDDLTLLARCTAEHPRLAQAGEPAARELQARLDGKLAPVLRPLR